MTYFGCMRHASTKCNSKICDDCDDFRFVISQEGHWVVTVMAGKTTKSMFELSAKLLNGDVMPLSSLKGKVVLMCDRSFSVSDSDSV